MRFTAAACITLFLFLLGCTETISTSSGAFGDDDSTTRQSLFRFGGRQDAVSKSGVRPGALVRGNDQFVNPRHAAGSRTSKAIIVPRDGKRVEVSLVNASIFSASQAVLGDALGMKFTVAEDASGSITVQSTGPIPKEALLELFEAALSANELRLERHGSVVKVVRGSSGSRTFRLASNGVGDGASIIVAPLEFIAASQMVNLLEPLTADGLSVVTDKRRNLLMMSGKPKQLESALDAMNLFDVDVMEGKSVALVELDTADPESIVEELRTIFESDEGGNLDGVIEFIPNKRLGAVLVITSRSTYLAKAQKWIRQLDKSATGASRYIEKYDLQHRSAKDVEPILRSLLSEGPSQNSETNRATNSGGGIKVAADEGRNVLVVRATRSEHREIGNLLKHLDSSPQQVMLEATIAEVSLSDDLDFGVRWFFERSNFDLTFSDSEFVGATSPGFSAVFSGGGAVAALNALAGVTDVKIISSPTLMVLDDQEAVLQIGDQVPIATQSSASTSSDNAPEITRIEYRDTGVILKVKPNISANGRVVLDITQEISSVSETKTSGIDSPTIRQRRIATNVLLNDGTTLALGGLVQERNTKTVTKVPGLGDVPVLGTAFKRNESVKRRSELLIFIRPRVIYTDDDAITATDIWRNKLSGANSILQTGLGSPNHSISEVFE